jgi:small subunit ribosomal protein S3
MGQKCHPRGLRIGVIEGWDSLWFSGGDNYADLLEEDLKIRKFLKERLYRAGISKIKIARRANQIEIVLFTARPGIIIGKGGRDVAIIRDELVRMTGKQVQLDVAEEQKPEISAQLVAENIALQLEKRVAYRRAMKQAVTKVLRSGGKGIKVQCKGRLAGSEIARCEWYRRGRVPLHTLRAKIDFGFAEALTVYGKIGVQIWIYTGEVLGAAEKQIRDVVEQGAKTIAKQEEGAGKDGFNS